MAVAVGIITALLQDVRFVTEDVDWGRGCRAFVHAPDVHLLAVHLASQQLWGAVRGRAALRAQLTRPHTRRAQAKVDQLKVAVRVQQNILHLTAQNPSQQSAHNCYAIGQHYNCIADVGLEKL